MAHISFGPFSTDAPIDCSLWPLKTLILIGPVDEQSGAGETERFSSTPFQQNLVVTWERVTEDETSRSFVKRQSDALRKADVRQIPKAEPEEVLLPNGDSGLITEQVIVFPGGERIRQMQLVTIKDQTAYNLIASHQDGDPFEASRHIFREMLLHFQWL
jgi:hypothetical protein